LSCESDSFAQLRNVDLYFSTHILFFRRVALFFRALATPMDSPTRVKLALLLAVYKTPVANPSNHFYPCVSTFVPLCLSAVYLSGILWSRIVLWYHPPSSPSVGFLMLFGFPGGCLSFSIPLRLPLAGRDRPSCPPPSSPFLVLASNQRRSESRAFRPSGRRILPGLIASFPAGGRQAPRRVHDPGLWSREFPSTPAKFLRPRILFVL